MNTPPSPTRGTVTPRRLFSSMAIRWMRTHRRIGLPKALLPWKLRQVGDLWPEQMQRDYVDSLGTRLPYDLPCELERIPEGPRAEVDPRHRLSPAELTHFWDHGFLAPFKVFEPEQMQELGARLRACRSQNNPVYGRPTDRDRHLEVPAMMRAMQHPAIVERLAQLLGPSLMTWRSQIFDKPPGGRAIAWHQASTYFFEKGFTEPLVVPPDLSELFMLTVWIPCDPATEENGCLRFVRGSFRGGIRRMRLGGDEGFVALSFEPDYEVSPDDIIPVEVQPGEVLIFSERTVHGSQANRSNDPRFAFNYRVVPSNVKVYPDPTGRRQHKASHEANQMNERYDLSRWTAVQLRGTPGTLNRTASVSKDGHVSPLAPNALSIDRENSRSKCPSTR